MGRPVVCLTTLTNRRDGEKMARLLVQKRLAACVNVIPGVVSFYHWKGKLCRSREVMLLIKTTTSRVSALEKELHARHPYELPEFIVLPIVKGSRHYLAWLGAMVL